MTKSTHVRYDIVASALVRATPTARGMIFGNPSLMIHGKVFAGLFGEAMVFKLVGVAHARALALAGTQLFDPLRRGRPMKAWVEVPARHADRWSALARAALRTVSKTRTAPKGRAVGSRLSPWSA